MLIGNRKIDLETVYRDFRESEMGLFGVSVLKELGDGQEVQWWPCKSSELR